MQQKGGSTIESPFPLCVLRAFFFFEFGGIGYLPYFFECTLPFFRPLGFSALETWVEKRYIKRSMANNTDRSTMANNTDQFGGHSLRVRWQLWDHCDSSPTPPGPPLRTGHSWRAARRDWWSRQPRAPKILWRRERCPVHREPGTWPFLSNDDGVIFGTRTPRDLDLLPLERASQQRVSTKRAIQKGES